MSTYNHSKSLAFTIHKVVFLMDKLADKTLQYKLNLTYSQFLILMALDHNLSCSQSKIAHFLELTEPAVSRQTDLLLGKKLISKQENPQNRREDILTLTTSGRKQLHNAFHILDKKYSELFKVIAQKERKTLTNSLTKLLDVVCADKDLHCQTNKKGGRYDQ